MKKLFYAIPILLLYGICRSEAPSPGEVTKSAARLTSSYVAETVFQSSQTCASTALHSLWISSPYPANLYAINVSSPASGTSLITIVDGVGGIGNGRVVSVIDPRTSRQHFYNVAFSSWLGVNSVTTTGAPPCIDIIYKVR